MSFLKSSDFKSIYKKLPKTGETTAAFAKFMADSKTHKIFESHFKRIRLINCHNLQNVSEEPTSSPCQPEIAAAELYSGPAALKFAQEGKKVAVLIFADSTNVGGIFMSHSGFPASTQEEQTVLMAPEIYSFLGNKYGVHDIGGVGDGIYTNKQKRYCLEKKEYEKPEVINPAYGFIITNLLMTHDIKQCSEMIKLPMEEVVEVSYVFLSMPSFATGVSRDPVGAMLIGQSEEDDGERIYKNISQANSAMRKERVTEVHMFDKDTTLTIGKIAIFYSYTKLNEFAKKYLGGDLGISDIIAAIIKAKILINQDQLEMMKDQLKINDINAFKDDVMNIINESQNNYRECILNKFTCLIRGAEAAEADTLVLGKIGCGAFRNDEKEISYLMGKSLAKCKSIKHVYFAGMSETDPFIDRVKEAMLN